MAVVNPGNNPAMFEDDDDIPLSFKRTVMAVVNPGNNPAMFEDDDDVPLSFKRTSNSLKTARPIPSKQEGSSVGAGVPVRSPKPVAPNPQKNGVTGASRPVHVKPPSSSPNHRPSGSGQPNSSAQHSSKGSSIVDKNKLKRPLVKDGRPDDSDDDEVPIGSIGNSMELQAIGKRPRASSGSSSLASDRLSSLPDCLIHHIMSFLKARQVVQTCVLSTRWRHLWRSVPCLDIDLEEFKTAGPNRDANKEWQEFEDFTDHLLIPNNISIAHLDTFRMQLGGTTYTYPYEQKGKQAARWIRHGIKYSGQDVGIQRKELNPTSWHLKRLHLSNVDLDDRFMNHVSSGCPYLEDLELKYCQCSFHEITSHTLKNLILMGCRCNGLSVITSPKLNSLIINGGLIGFVPLRVMAPAVASLLLDTSAYDCGVSFDEMSSLAKASIFLRNSVGGEHSKEQFKLLCSMSNVTNLVLSGFQTMVISEEFPEFQNLRTLLLEECDLSDNFQMLGHFLHHSPNLEKLILRYCKYSRDRKKKKGKAKLIKGCLNQFDVQCKNLKLTEIIYEDDDVQKLVELLLSISGDLPNNNIKLTKVDPDHP